MSMNIIERAISYTYTTQADEKIFALAAKAGKDTVFLFYTAGAIREQLEAHNTTLFAFNEDGVRWKGPQVVHGIGKAHFAALRFPGVRWDRWKVGSNGYMSDAQEQAIMEMLNAGAGMWDKGKDSPLKGKRWIWTGHNHRRGISDLLAEDKSITLEVKGVGARMFHS